MILWSLNEKSASLAHFPLFDWAARHIGAARAARVVAERWLMGRRAVSSPRFSSEHLRTREYDHEIQTRHTIQPDRRGSRRGIYYSVAAGHGMGPAGCAANEPERGSGPGKSER
jgi:hypothetical protein